MSGPVLDVRLLGRVEVRRDGVPMQLGGARQRALLALLAVQPGRARSVDDLVEELWAGEPPDAAATSLRTYVTRLRRALGNEALIARRDGGYALDVPTMAVDAARVAAHVKDAERAIAERRLGPAKDRLREALDLFRGEPFGDVGDVPALATEAVRLAELQLHALELRLDVDLRLGASDALVDELEAAVQRYPHRERLWHHLMVALYWSGRQADALATYHRARRFLDDELGVDPGPELQALEAAILRQEVPAVARPEDRHNLPEPVSTFIGREAEIESINALLAQHRMLTLTGVGGVGKTRLAIEAARRLLREFPDGVWFIDFTPLQDPELVPGRVAAVLQVVEQQGIPMTVRLASSLKAARTLLVLDNCEHVREAVAATVAALLPAAPDVRVLATSREVLGVPGEALSIVPTLGLPAAEAGPEEARRAEAVRLFLERAREVFPALRDDDDVVRTVARICADLDGLPLGIELAAARARALAPEEIAARLRDRFRFLVSWRQLSPARHRTLREAMDWSYGLLPAREQRMLRYVSVFAGGWTLEAAAEVCADADGDTALEALERLVEASLVSADTSGASTRFRMLETVRQYGVEALEAAGEASAARDRHMRFFEAYAQRMSDPMRRDLEKVLPLLIAERDNVRAALAWAAETESWPTLVAIAEGFWWFWWIRGELSEGRVWLQLAADHPEGSDPALHTRATLGLAGLMWAQADGDAALHLAQRARTRFAELGLKRYEGSALNTIGLVLHQQGDILGAQRALEAALDCYRSPLVDPEEVVRNIPVTLDNLASAAHDLRQDEKARALYEEARALNLARGDLASVAMNDLHLGINEAEQGLWASATVRFASALDHYGRVGFLQYMAECFEGISVVANGFGRPDEAAFMLGAADRLRDQAGVPPVPFMSTLRAREAATVRAALGDAEAAAQTRRGQATPPEAAIERALELLRSRNDVPRGPRLGRRKRETP